MYLFFRFYRFPRLQIVTPFFPGDLSPNNANKELRVLGSREQRLSLMAHRTSHPLAVLTARCHTDRVNATWPWCTLWRAGGRRVVFVCTSAVHKKVVYSSSIVCGAFNTPKTMLITRLHVYNTAYAANGILVVVQTLKVEPLRHRRRRQGRTSNDMRAARHHHEFEAAGAGKAILPPLRYIVHTSI